MRSWVTAVSAFVLAAAAGAAPLDRLNEWQQFRAAYPYHIQTVALSGPDLSGRRLLIVSEPPPNVSLTQLAQVAPELLSEGVVEWYRIGYDGAVADALFDFAPSRKTPFAVSWKSCISGSSAPATRRTRWTSPRHPSRTAISISTCA